MYRSYPFAVQVGWVVLVYVQVCCPVGAIVPFPVGLPMPQREHLVSYVPAAPHVGCFVVTWLYAWPNAAWPTVPQLTHFLASVQDADERFQECCPVGGIVPFPVGLPTPHREHLVSYVPAAPHVGCFVVTWQYACPNAAWPTAPHFVQLLLAVQVADARFHVCPVAACAT